MISGGNRWHLQVFIGRSWQFWHVKLAIPAIGFLTGLAKENIETHIAKLHLLLMAARYFVKAVLLLPRCSDQPTALNCGFLIQFVS